MTARELIEKLSEFDGDLEVGDMGHFGERLEIHDVSIHKETSLSFIDGELIKNRDWIVLSIEYAGAEPD